MDFAILSKAFGIEFHENRALVNVIEVWRLVKQKNIEICFAAAAQTIWKMITQLNKFPLNWKQLCLPIELAAFCDPEICIWAFL